MGVPNPKWQPGTGKQVILKSDFVDLENAILVQGTVRMQPRLVWVATSTVGIEATPDCVAAMQFTGMPNILNPAIQASGGLSDGKVRSVTGNVSMDFGAAGMYGATQTEMASQWYAIWGVAADDDTDFILKTLPFMRVKSQASQVISCSENISITTARNYGFTADDALLLGGKVYFLSGASRGLMRTIIHNNVASSATTLEYSGGALSLAAGDWFLILPPTNFRLVGSAYNNSSSSFDAFFQHGNQTTWSAPRTIAAPTVAPSTEDITCAPPTAIAIGVMGNIGTTIGHPDGTNYIEMGSIAYTLKYDQHTDPVGWDADTPWLSWTASGSDFNRVQALVAVSNKTFAESPIKNCKYKGAGATMGAIYYKHPPGCGF